MEEKITQFIETWLITVSLGKTLTWKKNRIKNIKSVWSSLKRR